MRRDRRNKISILIKQSNKNSFGETVKENVVFKQNIWASKEPLLGKEFFEAQRTNSSIEVKFNMDYISGVSNEMIVKDSEGIYEIVSAINVKSLNRELLLYCRKVS